MFQILSAPTFRKRRNINSRFLGLVFDRKYCYMAGKRILLLEPYYGGSHKQLIDMIRDLFPKITDLYTMPAKKWHWRSLTSSLHFAEMIPKEHEFCVLFSSSVLPLAELIALRPDLAKLHKIAYFHENQFTYPVQERKQRYFQHGFNDILTCLVADKVLFNSQFNKESFLSNLSTYFNVMPDFKPRNLEARIRPKCEITYFPIDVPLNFLNCLSPEINLPCTTCQFAKSSNTISNCVQKDNLKVTNDKLHIVWPHRWEHDKDPDTFFSVLFRLKDEGEQFYLSVIGETFSEKPKIFEEAAIYLKENIINWGYKASKEEYYSILLSADAVVSTSIHEFFGVSMLEAVSLNCYPLCPKRLVYPEMYPDQYLYNTPNQLFKKLKYFCRHPYAARHHKVQMDLSRYSWNTMKTQYMKIFTDAIS